MPSVPPRLQISDRRLAAARRRRRRGQIRLGTLIAVVVIVVVVILASAGGSSHRTASASVGASTGSTSSTTPSAARPAQTNPLTTRQIAKYIAGRRGRVMAAVDDLKTGKEWILNPRQRFQTASIVKANILEALLYQAQQNGTPLSEVETSTAQQMIEASDNDDASDLYSQIGGNAGLDAYDHKIGMLSTAGGADGYWGETLTNPADQIKLLQQLAEPKTSVLHAAEIDYQLGLMHEIDPGENWGATGGVPASGVTVALKNGWVPLTSNTDWEVNTIGWVQGDGHDYLIALMTAHDPSEDYGINTLDALSKDIYDTLGPAPAPGTKTIQVVPSG
jgi:hypothetical protein